MSLLLTIVSILSLVHSKRKSKKWFKGRHSEFSLPIGVCFEKERIHDGIGPIRSTSFRLMCEDDDGPDGDRKVVAYHYRDSGCQNDIAYTDEFTTEDKREFPFNCYEEEELEGKTINEDDYAQNWMEVKLTRGKLVNVSSADDSSNATSTCVQDDSVNFYKKFRTITNKCVIAKQGNKYYWYYAACTMKDDNGTESAVYLERWDGFNCTGNQTAGYPLYKPDGCEVKWNDKYWYTEVVTCTHPDFTISAGYRTVDHPIIAIVFIIVVSVFNLQ